MTEIAEKLRREALQLPDDERSELTYCLLQSLGDEVRAVWEVELDQRWQEMESGVVSGVPAEQVFAEMRKKYP